MPYFGRFTPVLLCALLTLPVHAFGTPLTGDVNCSGAVNVTDVQLTILVALGLPISPLLDGDGDGIPDACAEPEVLCEAGTVPNEAGNGCALAPGLLEAEYAAGFSDGVASVPSITCGVGTLLSGTTCIQNLSFCDGSCTVAEEDISPDCDGLCDLTDPDGSPDCSGGCIPGDTAGSPACDGLCTVQDSPGSADCDGMCSLEDEPNGPDCEVPFCEDADLALNPGCVGLAGPVERNFAYASGRGGHHEFLAGAGADFTYQEQNGLWYWLHVPSTAGSGIQIWTAPKGEPFVNQTAALLPADEVGDYSAFSSGIFVDLNNDGWDDLLFARNKGPYDVHTFLYVPEEGNFQALPFTQLHDQDGSLIDTVQLFFGHKNISYRTVKLLRADIDGDGDDDIFVGRNHANYIFKNLTESEWGMADIQNPIVTKRFERHNLDILASKNIDGTTTFLKTEGAFTNQAVVVQLEGQVSATGTPLNFIAAVDSVCSSDDCMNKAGGQTSPLRVHLYGLRGSNQPCAAGNGLCEAGEVGTSTDCLGTNVESEEMSCEFVDHFRDAMDTPFAEGGFNWTDINGAALVAVDLDGDTYQDDLLVFDGVTADEKDAAVSCFYNPGSCANPSVTHQALIHTGNLNFIQSPAPEVFDQPHLLIKGATTVDTNNDGLDELLAYSAFTPISPCDGCLETPFALYEKGANGWEQTNAPGLFNDFSRSLLSMHAGHFDENENEDVAIASINGVRTFWGKETPAGGPGITTDYQLPAFSQNMMAPVLADLNGDGHQDVIIKTWADTEQDQSLIVYLQNNGMGGFDYHPEVIDPGLPLGPQGFIEPFDMDGDGDLDLAISQTGPFLLLENEGSDASQSGSLPVFTSRPDLVPDWFDAGGTFYGDAEPPCWPLPEDGGQSAGHMRCLPFSILSGDFDGNGEMDLAISRRKGANDILFNNLSGSGCETPSNGPCPATRFLSARWDQGIHRVLPITDTYGFSASNRVQHLHLFPGAEGAKPSLLVSTIPEPWFNGPSEALFLNEITGPLPKAHFCADNSDCMEGSTCLNSPFGAFADWKTCGQNGTQDLTSGWFAFQQGAFPPRGSEEEAVGKYAQTACTASDDLNGDGYQDLVVVTSVGNRFPDLSGDYELSELPCTLFEPSGGPQENPTYCDYYAQCTPAKCLASNPLGVGFEGVDPKPESDPSCCIEGSLDNAYLPKPACYQSNTVDECTLRGFVTAQPLEFEVFAYLYEPNGAQGPAFTKVVNPLGVVGAEGTETLDCALADLNADGAPDLILANYDTGFHPTLQQAHPELLSGLHYQRRRRHQGLGTSIWLNPGWTNSFELPFTPGNFPAFSDKVYHVDAGDIDGDGLLEILTTGALTVSLYDELPSP